MRVLFNTYPWAFATPGGGEIQLLKYFEHLPSHSIKPVLHNPWKPELGDIDLVHYFSCVGGSLPFCRYVRDRGLPLVVSSSLWVTQASAQLYPIDEIRAQLAAADVIVPNSSIEADTLASVFELPLARFIPVMNGVDVRFTASIDPTIFLNRFKITEPFALCVANIEPRKNQLNLIRALAEDGPLLVLIGEIREPRYWQQVVAEMGPRVMHIGALRHDDPLLASAYAACAVFVLPSMLETPGLAALEAAAVGAPIVITSVGSTHEYFLDMAHYVDPTDWVDLRSKIRTALLAGRNPDLKRHIAVKYTWPVTTTVLKEVYTTAVQTCRTARVDARCTGR